MSAIWNHARSLDYTCDEPKIKTPLFYCLSRCTTSSFLQQKHKPAVLQQGDQKLRSLIQRKSSTEFWLRCAGYGLSYLKLVAQCQCHTKSQVWIHLHSSGQNSPPQIAPSSLDKILYEFRKVVKIKSIEINEDSNICLLTILIACTFINIFVKVYVYIKEHIFYVCR